MTCTTWQPRGLGLASPRPHASGRRAVFCNVVAPPSPITRAPKAPTAAEQMQAQPPSSNELTSTPSSQSQDFWSVGLLVASTTAYASQLMSHFRGWGALAPSAEQASVAPCWEVVHIEKARV